MHLFCFYFYNNYNPRTSFLQLFIKHLHIIHTLIQLTYTPRGYIILSDTLNQLYNGGKMMREDIYDIGGMHCAACSSAVERVTRKLAGVERSDVNLPLNRLTISYDENVCTPDKIIEKIEKAGFTAQLHIQPDKKNIKKTEAAETGNIKKQAEREKISLIVSICFAGLLLFVSMGQMLIPNMPVPDIFSMHTHPVNFAMLQMLLAIPVLFIGKRFFISGFKSLFHGNPNMDTLVAISSTASFIFSLVMTFLMSDNAHLVHNLYYESAAVVVALVSVGKYMEARSKEKTKDAITRLMKLAPETAILANGDIQREVSIDQVKVGDTVLVKPGARVPLDGIVIRGEGSINEAMLTGESLPVEKTEGSEVIGGSISVDGALYVRVTRTGDDTTLSRIIRFVEDAQGKKAPISKTADKVAGIFVPAVIAVALIASIIWLICGAEFFFALKIFTSVLVIACPCAMGLATPTAIIVGTGLGASKGILVRSGEALEITHGVKVAIFDKTGTITQGKPVVTDMIADDANDMLSAASALESLSEHPLSKAICAEAEKHSIISYGTPEQFENISGRGLKAISADGDILLAGNTALMNENGISTDSFDSDIERLQQQGKTVVVIARNDIILGLIAIADTIKPDAAEAIARLRSMGVTPVLLTGDNKAAASYISQQAGISEIVAEVLPTEKAEVVRQYQESGNIVMMVGDGINDAPALVQADIGCAIGNGSDIAIDSADIVLMKNELMDVCRAIRLGQLTIRNIKQNLFWAFCYNTLGIPIAAGVLYPAFGMLLSPMIGAVAMSLSSLFVVSNALSLKRKKL